MHLIKTSMRTALLASAGLLAVVSAGACLAQQPPSTQRAPLDASARTRMMEEHYSSGKFVLALVTAKRLCLQEGVQRACILGGEILEKGMGVPAKPEEAVKFYDRACVEKDKAMCLRAADIHLALVAKEPVPDGVYEDDWIGISESAAAYGAMAAYHHACELGDAQACYKGAGMYFTRFMGKRALQEYSKGCELGHADSCNGHALALQYGLKGPDGIPFDPAGAKAYFRKACDLGRKDACAKAK